MLLSKAQPWLQGRREAGAGDDDKSRDYDISESGYLLGLDNSEETRWGCTRFLFLTRPLLVPVRCPWSLPLPEA